MAGDTKEGRQMTFKFSLLFMLLAVALPAEAESLDFPRLGPVTLIDPVGPAAGVVIVFPDPVSLHRTPSASLRALLEAGGVKIEDLPLVLLPADPHGKTMAVIYSGDGGWRDLDKKIGEELQKARIPVVGVDTLRYFWHRQTPEMATAGLERIIGHFVTAWNTPDVLLIGYSFGADIIPFMVNRVKPAVRDHIRLISLLSLSRTAEFEIHMKRKRLYFYAYGPVTGLNQLHPQGSFRHQGNEVVRFFIRQHRVFENRSNGMHFFCKSFHYILKLYCI
jgi:hypothetical protein